MPSITFLFRFRDLVAPTIKEHKIIIQEAGWCWWGWWKRPSEDARGDIWESIAEQLKTGTIDVGLFDSGTGRVYRATVEKIIPPSDDASSFVDNTIMVPNNEIDHVPRYYRDSIFSRAWLKINKIDDKSLKFFGSYSFSELNYTTILCRLSRDLKTRRYIPQMNCAAWTRLSGIFARPSRPTQMARYYLAHKASTSRSRTRLSIASTIRFYTLLICISLSIRTGINTFGDTMVIVRKQNKR
jgi:hypothetical protein